MCVWRGCWSALGGVHVGVGWAGMDFIYGWNKAMKSLYRGKVHYCLWSCQSTLNLSVGKEENNSCVFQNNLLKTGWQLHKMMWGNSTEKQSKGALFLELEIE